MDSSINKRRRNKWLKLIDECMAQDRHGLMQYCTFCNAVRARKSEFIDCSKCICTDYADAQGIEVVDPDGHFACDCIVFDYRETNLTREKQLATAFWDKNIILIILSNMREWLENK